MNKLLSDVLKIMPSGLKTPLSFAFEDADGIYEVRMICGESVYLVTENGTMFLDENGNLSRFFPLNALKPTVSELSEITDRSIGYSGFFRENELKNGYITYSDGIRIGLCGDASAENRGIGKITSLNIRIPYFGKADTGTDFGKLFSFSSGLLIAGAPSSGKTTLLRGIAEWLSRGKTGEYQKVCIIDERGELTAGRSLGPCADVIKGMKKADAILHAVRLLSPRYIICDEIGGTEETKSILQGLNSGVSFIASIHAGDVSSLVRRQQFRILFSENVFDKAVFLSSSSPGKITAHYSYGELLYEIRRSYEPLHGNNAFGAVPFASSE
ncbi:MAG: Flp pilus assembly complex ATPase component TadA [Clostridia bacterium]|nr:Flp pilus assembly complex ATPase component TadA [Clostridia bacterium]